MHHINNRLLGKPFKKDDIFSNKTLDNKKDGFQNK